MKKMVFAFILTILLCFSVSCGDSGIDTDSFYFKPTELTEKTSYTDDTSEEITADTQVAPESAVYSAVIDELKKSVFVNTSAGTERSFSTLYQLTGTGVSADMGDLEHIKKCGVVKITPYDYEFYITVDHLSSTDVLFTGYTILKARVDEVVSNFNGSYIKANENITIWQNMYITPSDEYMQDFIDTYGKGDKTAIPDDSYKIAAQKLVSQGVKRIVTSDVPLLELNKSYFVFVTEENSSGYSFCYAYCTDELDMISISDNYSYTYDYERLTKELIQIINEYKK